MKTDQDDRIKRREYTVRLPEIDAGKGLIIAAIIMVLGSFVSKLVYDYIQEQRIKRALNEAVIYMQNAVNQSAIETRQLQKTRHQDQLKQRNLIQQEQKQQHINRISSAVQREKNQLLAAKRSSKECKFWSLQHENNPSLRTSKKKSISCGFAD